MFGSFEDLEVWKQCRELRKMIFSLVKKKILKAKNILLQTKSFVHPNRLVPILLKVMVDSIINKTFNFAE
jgi:hypothetical protein